MPAARVDWRLSRRHGWWTSWPGVLERAKFDRWTRDGRGLAYVAGLVAIAEMRDDVPAAPSVTDDPDDDLLIALATSSTADYVTSVDRHLFLERIR